MGKLIPGGYEQASTMSKFPLRKGSVCGSFTGQAYVRPQDLANDLFYEQWEGAVGSKKWREYTMVTSNRAV